LVDAEEDPCLARALDDTPERGDLLRHRRRETGLPEARDPNRPEPRLLQLRQRGPLVADGVVDGADEERLVVAAAAGERQRGERERTAKGTLVRTTGLPGLVAWTNETESR